MLTEYTAGVWFIHGLLPTTAEELIRKYTVAIGDPDTVDYPKMLIYVTQQTASDNSI